MMAMRNDTVYLYCGTKYDEQENVNHETHAIYVNRQDAINRAEQDAHNDIYNGIVQKRHNLPELYIVGNYEMSAEGAITLERVSFIATVVSTVLL